MQDLELAIDLNSFNKTFISDNAEYSLQAYLSKIGDTIIEVTPWTSSTRTIHYDHPINVPMAPPSAKANKQQTLKMYGLKGIYIETCTQVDDVPLTDCFVVDDQIFVESFGDGVKVNAFFEIRFTKSTIWKRVITNTTNEEFRKFFVAYGDMLQDVIMHGTPLLEQDENEKELQSNQDTRVKPKKESITLFIFILLVSIILMQQYLMHKQTSMFEKNYLVLQEQNQKNNANWMEVMDRLDKILSKSDL